MIGRGYSLLLLSQVRPQFWSDHSAAYWNYWFMLAYLCPLFMIAIFGQVRFSFVFTIPLSIVVFLLCYFYGIEGTRVTLGQIAVSRHEIDIVSADTGLVFAPYFHGVPLSIAWTSLIAVCVFLRNVARLRLEANEAEKVLSVTCMNCDRMIAETTRVCPRCMTRQERRDAVANVFLDGTSTNPYHPPTMQHQSLK